MSFVSSVFSNLKIGVGHSLASTGVNAAFNAINYRKRDGQLKFISPRGYDNVYVYAAKRTMMQMSFATINDLYPAYVRQLNRKASEAAYLANQGKELKKIIINGRKADEDAYNEQKVVLKYKGKTANEGLLMWIKTEDTAVKKVQFDTYWDKIKGLSNEDAAKASINVSTEVQVPGDDVFLDLGAIVQAQSANNVVLTKVVGRDYSRKELVSGGDVNFTVTGKITSNYPDVYPYAAVSKFITLMQYKGVIQVYNILFQQFKVRQILIKDFQMGQNEGFKNVQPYSFTCVAVEPDENVTVVEDTIGATNLNISKMKKKGWAQVLLDKVKASAADQAAQMLEQLTSNAI